MKLKQLFKRTRSIPTSEKMYGVVDIDAWADATIATRPGETYNLALIVTDLMAEACDLLDHDSVAGKQTLARARFLMLRYCPLLNPVNDDTISEG